jgi:hypothetical protein
VHDIGIDEVSTYVMRHNPFLKCIKSFEIKICTNFMFVQVILKQKQTNKEECYKNS